MTHTTVHKVYEAPSLAEAAELLLRDDDVWRVEAWEVGHGIRAESDGYRVEGWRWDAVQRQLTVDFR